jgi:hypothetical protein
VEIGNNAKLTSLEGLSGLVSLDAALTIEDNPVLPDLRGLERLERVDHWVDVLRNPSLVSLGGLDALTSTKGLLIMECAELTTLRALAALSLVDGSLAVQDNVRLPTCEAEWLRNHVQTVTGPVTIDGNDDQGACP